MGGDQEILRSYLSDRVQYVSSYRLQSAWGRMDYGVPQALVLGPLLPILWFFDLPDKIGDNGLVMFCR